MESFTQVSVMKKQGQRLVICTAVHIMVLLCSAETSRGLEINSSANRQQLFRFSVPSRYRGAVLGPETYGWLEERYGQDSLDKAGVHRAPTDEHACGQKGWCKDSCLPTETKDWTLKDLCGVLNCCAPLESSDYEHSEDPSKTESIYLQS
ncbi:big defensin-like [Pomacea canaliculata]|uniref:big defensin-like n=1 Tax=Pomacea canaliculata TaxID=400727 RepID=UPI000D737EAB|nr:big defensin-like [Pomacea canaliculata]